jgi:uncharacterized protein (TIGR01777 family)
MVLAGGTGFIGAALARRFRERGHEVVVLTRSVPRRRSDGVREVQWDPAAVRNEGQPGADPTIDYPTQAGRRSNPIGYFGGGPPGWAAALEGADAVINLAGSSIATVHTAENRRRILESRLASVHALGAAVQACAQPPRVWVQASAVGIYGTGAARRDETAPTGGAFPADVCVAWEAAFRAACPPAVRDVVLRVGVVLGRKGGAYPRLARVAQLFLGSAAGDGAQGISWILLDDLEEIFLRAVSDATMRGVYNACAPEPVSNAEFMRELRASLGRPWSPPVPAFALRIAAPLVMRTDPSLVLEGQFVVPARLEAAGFRFRAPRLAGALRALAG